MASIDTEWFTHRLRDRGLSQRGLAKLMNIDPAAISLTFRGRRRLPLEEAAQLAVLLGVSTTEVLEHAGMPLHGEPKCPLVGRLTNTYEVVLHGEGAHDTVDSPPGMPADCQAIQARTVGTDQDQIDGWIYYVSGTKGNATKALGDLAMTAIKGDGIKIAHVKKGYARGTYNLLTPKGEMLTNTEIAWAAPVLWIKTQI
jgi:hypothetical protein